MKLPSDHAVDLRALADKWERAEAELASLARRLSLLDIEPVYTTTSFGVRFSGNREKLLAAMRAVYQAGYRLPKDCSRPEEKSPSWCAWFCHQNPDFPRLWFWFESSVCRLVQTGTKMVERPVYEVSCGEVQNEQPL
jgi:hypothetical protein